MLKCSKNARLKARGIDLCATLIVSITQNHIPDNAMIQHKLYKGNCFLFALLCSVSLGATANNCYEESPNFLALGDIYFDIEDRPHLLSEETSQLDEFFESIEGDWEGGAILSECFGRENNPDRRGVNAEIEADLKAGRQGALRIKYEVLREREKTRKVEKISLAGDRRNQYFETGNNSVTVSEKYRPGNDTKWLEEKVVEVSRKRNGLEVNITIYVNGFLASDEAWTLQRR